MYEIKIQFKDAKNITSMTVEDYNLGPTAMILHENDTELTIVPLGSFLYMDIERIED